MTPVWAQPQAGLNRPHAWRPCHDCAAPFPRLSFFTLAMHPAPLLSRLLRQSLWLCLTLSHASQAQNPPHITPKRTTPFNIVMVLPYAPQSTEAGFRNYLERENMEARYIEVIHPSKIDATALRQQVAALKPDLIYALGTPAALALAGRYDQSNADNPLKNLPILFTDVAYPVHAKLLKDPSKPERNITGVSHVAPLEIQFNAIKAYRPFQKIGYLHNPAETNSRLILSDLRALAQRQGWELIEARLELNADQEPNPAQIAPLVADIAARGAELLYIGPIEFLGFANRDVITQAALQHKLPTFCTTESIVQRSDCLFGLFSNDTNIGRFAGHMAQQLLVEKKPVSTIAASTPQRFSLLINMRIAQALELYPPMLLLNVAEVTHAAPAAVAPSAAPTAN